MEEFVFETQQDSTLAPASNDRSYDPIKLIEADQSFAESISNIPNKMAFKIGEAAKIVGVKTYVLRYWETEFKALKPKKSNNNQRVFSKKDIELAMIIKKLLHKDRFSIEGAKTALTKMKKETKKSKAIHGAISRIDTLKDSLQDLIFEIDRIQKKVTQR